MASLKEWVQGARPLTLINSASTIMGGVAAAFAASFYPQKPDWLTATLTAVMIILFNIAVNFANDYSDGIKGTDDTRIGPVRLVGSKRAKPEHVRNAAIVCLILGSIIGLVVCYLTTWKLIILGILAVAGAWFYTGGKNPYGYKGYGEVAAFVFFGLLGVIGIQYVSSGNYNFAGILIAIGVGSYSASVMLINNLRDVKSDTLNSKNTIAVKYGDETARTIFFTLLALPIVVSLVLTYLNNNTLWALLAAIPSWLAWQPVMDKKEGKDLLVSFKFVLVSMLLWSIIILIIFVKH